MNEALKKYTGDDNEEFEDTDTAADIVKNQLSVLDSMFNKFDSGDYFNCTPLMQLECLNRAVEYVQDTKDLEKRFMEGAKKIKHAYNLCYCSLLNFF